MLENDFRWTTKMALKIAILGFFTGVLAAMLGIGGGVILAPLLLQLKMEPRVQSFTSAFMAFFTATATVIQYIIFGALNYAYAGVSILFGLFGMIFGLCVILEWVKRKNRQSYIVIVLSGVVFVAAILIIYSGVIGAMHEDEKGVNIWETKSFC